MSTDPGASRDIPSPKARPPSPAEYEASRTRRIAPIQSFPIRDKMNPVLFPKAICEWRSGIAESTRAPHCPRHTIRVGPITPPPDGILEKSPWATLKTDRAKSILA